MRRMPCSLQKILLLLMLIVGVSQIVLFHSYFATSTSHVPMQQPQQKPPRPHDVYAKEADDGNNNKNNNSNIGWNTTTKKQLFIYQRCLRCPFH
mmetsp:Transcript_14444/g.31104  ORF Transcript_14444/g.31104 Transcript_14444/m.31104 type:complete len:94 (-) Transcript_14444:1490-1771(-)